MVAHDTTVSISSKGGPAAPRQSFSLPLAPPQLEADDVDMEDEFTPLLFDDDMESVHPRTEEDDWEGDSNSSDESADGLLDEDEDDVIPPSFTLFTNEDSSNRHPAEDGLPLNPTEQVRDDHHQSRVYASQSEFT